MWTSCANARTAANVSDEAYAGAVRVPASLAVLREREFSLLFWARAVSQLGGALAPVAVAFAIIDLTGSATDLGLVLAAHFVPMVLFSLVGGVIADRLPRHHVMVASDIVRGASQLLLAGLLLGEVAEVWMFVVVSAANGAAAAFFFPASQGIIPQLVPVQRLQEANALLRLSHSATQIGGTAVGGVLVALIGSSAAIAIDGLTFLVGAVLLAVMRVPPLPIAAQRFVSDLAEGWREFVGRTWLWVVVVAFAFINAFWTAGIGVLGPLVAEQSLGGPAAWGVILAALSSGLLVGGAVSLRFKPGRPVRAGMLGMLTLALPLLALASGAPLGLVVLAAATAGFGIEIFSVNWSFALQTEIEPEKLGRVNAYDGIGSIGLMPIGYAAVGPLADRIGVDETLYVCALVVLVASAATLAVPSVWRLRRLSLDEAAGEPGPVPAGTP